MSTDSKILTLERRLREMQETIKYVPSLVAPFLDLPGQVGVWHAGNVQRSTGNVYDSTGQARTLTYTGNPAYGLYNNLTPYLDLDGTGDYLTRADETDLDILGSETIYAAGVRGLTIISWCWQDAFTGNHYIASKYDSTGNQRAYALNFNSSGAIVATVSSDGTATTASTTTDLVTAGTWVMAHMVYTPSTSIVVGWNSIHKVSNTTSIPAAIFNCSAAWQIGAAVAGTLNLNGRWAITALLANALSDNLISSTFNRTRGLFGV